MSDATVNVYVAAWRLGVSRSTIRNMLRDGRLRGQQLKTVRGVRVFVDSLEQQERKQAACAHDRAREETLVLNREHP